MLRSVNWQLAVYFNKSALRARRLKTSVATFSRTLMVRLLKFRTATKVS